MLIGIFLLTSCTENIITFQKGEIQNSDLIKIASWNAQVLGQAKVDNPIKLFELATTIDNYDIVALQEIRDSSDYTINKLMSKLPNYNYEISARKGTTQMKEQYAFIVKKGIKVTNLKDYSEGFERPPFEIEIQKGNWTASISVIHIKPDDAMQEISTLIKTYGNRTDDLIILGDFNADCGYLNKDAIDYSPFIEIIPNDADTTTGATNCAYDRILMTQSASNNFIDYGIDKSINKNLSDHYPIYAEFQTNQE